MLWRCDNFLSSVSIYYRHFVANFADIAQPLYQCAERNQSYGWTTDTECAFNCSKHSWKHHPDQDGHFWLQHRSGPLTNTKWGGESDCFSQEQQQCPTTTGGCPGNTAAFPHLSIWKWRPCVLDVRRYCPRQEGRENQGIQMDSDAPCVSWVTLGWQASPLNGSIQRGSSHRKMDVLGHKWIRQQLSADCSRLLFQVDQSLISLPDTSSRSYI